MYPCRDCIHSKQGHPSWAMHYRSCEHPSVRNGKEGMEMLGVKISADSDIDSLIEEGWFIFPFNYDPAWINQCQARRG